MPTTLSLLDSSSDSSVRRVLTSMSLGVAKSKKIVVVTGAGISCSCGIPDFRSSDGLYNLVKQQYPDVVLKGRDLFDSSLFRDPTSTAVFYAFISKLKQSIDTVLPSPTHYFIKTLDLKGKLVRSYTQNIDGLEERVGLLGSASEEAKSVTRGKSRINLRDVKNVQLHGDIRRVRCTLCSADYPFTDEHTIDFLDGIAPDCPDCITRSQERVARSARALKVGKLRPAIVLYDEPHPLGDDIGSIETFDLARKPELLIIMGTSLKVHGLKKLVKEFAKVVHATAPGDATLPSSTKATTLKNYMKGKVIFINKTPPGGEWDGIIDYYVEGETDAWVERVLEDWKRHRPMDWEIQATLVNMENDFFKATKENAVTKAIKGIKTGKKSRRANDGEENIPPPASVGEVDPQASKIAMLQPSSSPKRRRNGSHYGEKGCSPTKKQHVGVLFAEERDAIPLEERGMLFGTSRTANLSNLVVEINTRENAQAKSRIKRVKDKSGRPEPENKLGVTSPADSVFS